MNSLWAIIATVIISLISFLGALTFFIKEKWLKKLLILLVGFAAGTLLGGALLHLLPEVLEEKESFKVFLFVLLGFVVFFLIEKFLHWHHYHQNDQCDDCPPQTLSHMNIVGDSLHNLIDGLLISAAFLTDFNLGLITAIAVAVHEIPQEISDFGVLIYGGFSKLKALFFNFLSALFAVLGAVIGILIFDKIETFIPYLLAITAGGFIYIAASDLIPEINKQKGRLRTWLSFLFFIAGLAFMYLIKVLFE